MMNQQAGNGVSQPVAQTVDGQNVAWMRAMELRVQRLEADRQGWHNLVRNLIGRLLLVVGLPKLSELIAAYERAEAQRQRSRG